MTKKEQKERAAIKKKLQQDGILPPDKKPLNRKKFIELAREEWASRERGVLIWDIYLMKAFAEVLALTDRRCRASPEAVGAAKVLRLAVRMQQFEKIVRDRGDGRYSVAELYEYTKDILEA